LSSQAAVTCAEVLLSRKWLDICLPRGSREEVRYALLAQAAFAFPFKLSSRSMCLLAFLLLFSPILWEKGVSKELGGCLAAGQHQPATAGD